MKIQHCEQCAYPMETSLYAHCSQCWKETNGWGRNKSDEKYVELSEDHSGSSRRGSQLRCLTSERK